MEKQFYQNYIGGKTSMREFQGSVTFTPLNGGDKVFIPILPNTEPEPEPQPVTPINPCEQETIIVITNPGGGGWSGGGSGGSGGSGGGSGGNGGSLMPHNSNNYKNYFYWDEVACTYGKHFGNNPECEAPFKGATYLRNRCTGEAVQVYGMNAKTGLIFQPNPCNPGNIGILEPVLLDASYWIVDMIDTKDLDPCTREVLEEVKGLSQAGLAKILRKLDASPSVYQVKMKTEYYPDEDSQAKANYTTSGIKYNYTITFNSVYTETATKLSHARTIMHELIHTYFFSLFDDAYAGTDEEAIKDYPLLFNLFVAKHYNNAGLMHHETMARQYVDVMARAMQEYQTGIPVPENIEPQEQYKDLAWSGLHDTAIFNQLYPPGSTERSRFQKRRAAEDLNRIYGEYEPISDKCTF